MKGVAERAISSATFPIKTHRGCAALAKIRIEIPTFTIEKLGIRNRLIEQMKFSFLNQHFKISLVFFVESRAGIKILSDHELSPLPAFCLLTKSKVIPVGGSTS